MSELTVRSSNELETILFLWFRHENTAYRRVQNHHTSTVFLDIPLRITRRIVRICDEVDYPGHSVQPNVITLENLFP